MTIIKIGSDFSRTPGGRFISDGPDSGQLFRDRFLVPRIKDAIDSNSKVTVIMDGPRGYLSSFLEEAFGGLVRLGLFTHDELRRHLIIRADDTFYKPYQILAQRAIEEARYKVAAAS